MEPEHPQSLKISLNDGLVAVIAAFGVYWTGQNAIWQFYYFRVPGSAFSTTFGLCAIGVLFAFGYLSVVLYRVADRNREALWSAYLLFNVILGVFLALQIQSAVLNLNVVSGQKSGQPPVQN